MAVQEVQILQGMHTGSLWVTFRDKLDVECDCRGITFRNPTVASMDRLRRVLNQQTNIGIERDGKSFYIVAQRPRKHNPDRHWSNHPNYWAEDERYELP